jgi:ribosome-associated translation inhibitor RaiA
MVEMSAKKTTKDMYASIDSAVAALAHQASKRKDLLRSQHAKRSSPVVKAKLKAKAKARRRDARR